MNRAEQKLLYELVKNPPKGSKIEAAIEFGVDLTLNLRLLRLSPHRTCTGDGKRSQFR
jgi:hypothetical protein